MGDSKCEFFIWIIMTLVVGITMTLGYYQQEVKNDKKAYTCYFMVYGYEKDYATTSSVDDLYGKEIRNIIHYSEYKNVPMKLKDKRSGAYDFEVIKTDEYKKGYLSCFTKDK